MAEYGQLLVDPSYRKSLIAAQQKTAAVEIVYDDGNDVVAAKLAQREILTQEIPTHVKRNRPLGYLPGGPF